MLVGQRQHGLRIDIAHHHHGGVGWRVPGFVELTRIVRGERLEIAHPADHRAAIGRGDEGHGALLLAQHGARVVVGAHAALFFHHRQFLGEFFVAVAVVGKAVRLQRHHVGQAVGGHLLVVAGVVHAGESVLAPAHGRHAARELARREFVGALEHHVFQHVGHAALAIDLVDRADAHPQHVHRGGRAAVGLDDEGEAVGQLELADRAGSGCRRSQLL